MNNSFKIANSIGMIDDDLIKEAGEIIERKAAPKKAVYPRYIAAAAACLCVAGGAAAIAKTRTPSAVADSNNSAVQITDNDLNGNTPIIKMSGINFNETPAAGSSVSSDMDLNVFDSVLLNSEGITEYFGREITPAYIPEGLIPSERNDSTWIYSDKNDGRIVIDRTELSFYHDYDEYGYPKFTESVDARKGFELIAAKAGGLDICCIVDISNISTASNIGDTDVYFAHFSVPLGKVSSPSGYYDEYVAEFELDGIKYRVTTSQLEPDEIVKIVSSIIYGENVSVEE